MIILGIDPGTATTGFGIIRVVGNSIKPVDYGVISTPAGVPMEQRLVMIYEQIHQIIETWKPEQVAIEDEGKEASAKRIAQIISQARKDGIKRVFYQSEFPESSVSVICEDIGANAVEINPLSED